MRVLLVNLLEPESEIQKITETPPIGLWSIRAYLQKRGCEVEIIDTTAGWIPDDDWDAIGISARFSVNDRQYRAVARQATRMCKNVIAGGFHAAFSEPLPGVKSVRGGGESAMAEALGLVGPEQLDDLDIPRFEHSEMVDYWLARNPHDGRSATKRWMPIETSRGCWRQCSFCAVPQYWGAWRGHSLDWMREHLDHLVSNGVEELFIEDDNVTRDWMRFRALMELFREYRMKWSAPNGIEIRSLLDNSFDPLELRESGCWRLSLPFETGCKETASAMGIGNKFLHFDEARELVIKLGIAGIRTCGFFIIGWPSETLEDMERTIMYANALPLDDRHIYIATPYPGTRLYGDAKFWVENGKPLLRFDPPELYARLRYGDAVLDGNTWKAEDVLEMRNRDRELAIKRRKYLG